MSTLFELHNILKNLYNASILIDCSKICSILKIYRLEIDLDYMSQKRLILISVFSVLVSAIIVIMAINYNTFELDISGNKITKDTYIQIMHNKVSDVAKHFKDKGVLNIDKEFWTKEIDGQIPYKVLTDKTVQELKQITAVYQIAFENNHIEKNSLENIWQRLDNENKARKEKIKNGQPVYGLAQYDMNTFLEYEIDTLQKLYCDNENNEGMKITDSQRQQYYDEYKDRLFVKNDDISISYIKVNFEQEDLSQEDYKKYKDMLNDVYLDYLKGKDKILDDIVNKYPNIKQYFKHIDLKSEEVGSYTKVIPDILEYSFKLKPNEMTNVIDENGCLYLVQCTNRTYHDYQPLDSVRNNIDKILREENYNEIIQKRANNLVVNVKMDKLYNFTRKNI